jgi:hypothetical protein
MDAWINHLLEDIDNAHRLPPILREPLPETKPQTFEEHMAEMEYWLAHGPEYTFAEYCGLDPEHFPPEHLLSDTQLDRLYVCFETMLFSWNLAVDIPINYPKRDAYPLLISTLDKKIEIPDDDDCNTIEFCSYNTELCIFKEYCTCKNETEDHLKGYEDRNTGNMDDFPF